ncbi:MAG TPA: hypothetical protein VIK34_06805 [Clostridiaceae bacterium]
MQEIRVNNGSMVKRLLNRTLNQLLKDEITTEKARTIGYLSSIILKALETQELEQRMIELERQLLKKGA